MGDETTQTNSEDGQSSAPRGPAAGARAAITKRLRRAVRAGLGHGPPEEHSQDDSIGGP
jgi:hypothetical protein